MNAQDRPRFKDNDMPRRAGVPIAVPKSVAAYRNLLRRVLFLFFCGALTGTRAEANKVDRDWTKYPAVVQRDFTQDVFIGDAHGDNDRLDKALKGAGIITRKTADLQWAAGEAVVVFSGDLIDKWKHSLQVIALVQSLRSAAAKQGGQVIVLMGNHEAEFLADPTSSKVQEFAFELDDDGLVPADVAACKGDLGQFLCSLPFAARIGDWFVAHGGN